MQIHLLTNAPFPRSCLRKWDLAHILQFLRYVIRDIKVSSMNRIANSYSSGCCFFLGNNQCIFPLSEISSSILG